MLDISSRQNLWQGQYWLFSTFKPVCGCLNKESKREAVNCISELKNHVGPPACAYRTIKVKFVLHSQLKHRPFFSCKCEKELKFSSCYHGNRYVVKSVNHPLRSNTAVCLIYQSCKTSSQAEPSPLRQPLTTRWNTTRASEFYSSSISVCSLHAAIATSLITRQEIFQGLKQQLQ